MAHYVYGTLPSENSYAVIIVLHESIVTITAAAANALIIVVLSCRCCMGTLHTQNKCTCKFAGHCIYLCTEPGSCSLCSRLWWFAV